MDEAGQTFPVIFWLRVRHSNVPFEVVVLFGKLIVFILIEEFTQRACTVPEADLTLGLQALQLVEDVGTHWRHTRTTTDEDHLSIRVFGEELTKWTVHSDLVAWLQVEHVRRHDTGRNAFGARWWRCNTDIELNHTLLFRIVSHRVRTDGGLFVNCLNVEEAVFLPVTAILFFDIEVGVVDFVRRTFQLYITTGAEVHVLAFRQSQCQFLNESCHVRVRNNRGLPLLNTEDFFRNFYIHILLNRSLTGQTPAFTGFTFSEVRGFGWQHFATTAFHHTLTLGTGTTTTTGR